MAEAAVFLMSRYDEPEIINVGVGSDVSIRELAQVICRVVGYEGQLGFDRSKAEPSAKTAGRISPPVTRLACQCRPRAGYCRNLRLVCGAATTAQAGYCDLAIAAIGYFQTGQTLRFVSLKLYIQIVPRPHDIPEGKRSQTGFLLSRRFK